MIASSASMPVEFLPPPPKLGLPPIAPVVAAAAAASVGAAIGKQLPHATGMNFRPAWSSDAIRSAAGGRIGGYSGMARPPVAGSPSVITPGRSAPTFQPIKVTHRVARDWADWRQGSAAGRSVKLQAAEPDAIASLPLGNRAWREFIPIHFVRPNQAFRAYSGQPKGRVSKGQRADHAANSTGNGGSSEFRFSASSVSALYDATANADASRGSLAAAEEKMTSRTEC